MSENLEKILDGITQVQQKFAELEGRQDTTDSDVKTALAAVEEKIGPALDDMQAQKQKLAAQEETITALQKEIAHGGTKGDNSELFKRYDDAMARTMRKNEPIPIEDMKAVTRDIAEKALYGADEDEINQEAKSLIAGSNADGGFFLTTERSGRMSTRIFETSPVRAVASIQSTTSDMYEIILDDDEPDAGWVGEVSTRSDTDTAQIALIKIPIHELYAQPKATQKMVDDAGFDIVGWHEGKVTRKFGRLENAAFTTGDGSEKPKGFTTYAAWTVAGTYQRNAVEQYTTAGSGAIAGDDLLGLQGSLIEDYQNASQWAMNRRTFFDDILTLKGTDDHYLINPRLIAEGGQMVLLGRPVNFFNDLPVVAANALSVCLADWQEFYTVVDRFGIRVLRDPYTAKPYIRFYTTKRVGGAVTNYEAGKLLKIKA